MKHLFFTCLFSACSITLFAQETFDFMLFRPGVQYLYDNPEFAVSTGSSVIGMKLEGTDTEGYSEAYLSAEYGEFGPCTSLIPSFAGRAVYQAEGRTIMAMDSARTDLVILENGAALGESWAATPSITAQVDSIREETFWSLTDDVKYISFRNTSDGSPVAVTIRISRNHGLLTGTYFRELTTTTSPLTLISLSQPQIGPQLPKLSDIINIPIGTELNIKRERSSEESRFTSVFREEQLTVLNNSFDEESGKARIDYIKNEYRYIQRAPDYLSQDQEFDENVQERFVYDLALHSFLDAQPGEVVFPTFDWWGNIQSNPQMGILRAKVFDCFGLGIGLPWLTRWDTINNCGHPPQESGTYGYYFSNLGGPYFTGGCCSLYNNDLIGAFGEDINCGESFDLTNPLGEVRLGEPFDWQLFRPGVQYLYEPTEGEDWLQHLGMKLTGNGEEAAYESYRGYFSGCPQQVPSFAGVRVRQEPALTSLLFYSDSLHLRSAAQIGESWMANDTTLATVDSIVMESFLGLTDSVKYISFSHQTTGTPIGTSIRIGKDYGLLTGTFFYDLGAAIPLELVGTSIEATGLQVPNFETLTAFEPGDEFHVKYIETMDSGSVVYYLHREVQYTVKERYVFAGNKVRIELWTNELSWRIGSTMPPDSTYRERRLTTMDFDLATMPYLDYQPGQLYEEPVFGFGLIKLVPPDESNCFGASVYLEPFGRSDDGCIYPAPFHTFGNFINGLAGPYYQFVEGSHVIQSLRYADNANGICGTPIDFNGLVDGVNDFQLDERIRLYPNPSDGHVNLEVPADLGPVSLTIFSITGQQVLSFAPASSNRAISLGPLPAGMYTIVFHNAVGAVGRRRVVKR
jgi:hypothetical protein